MMNHFQVTQSNLTRGHGDPKPCACRGLLIDHDVKEPNARHWWQSFLMYECFECGAAWTHADWLGGPELDEIA